MRGCSTGERSKTCPSGISAPILWAVHSMFVLAASLIICSLRSAEGAEPTRPNWLQARAGHIAFEAFGRDNSLTHVELMPHLRGPSGMLFGDARLFFTNEGYFGGNFGLGYRRDAPGGDRFFGGSFWYDIDDTTGELFQQLGVSLETCGPVWDIRSNLYFPIGSDHQNFEKSIRNQRFVGNNIEYDILRDYGEAMQGADFEYGLLLPFELSRAYNVRAHAGAYYFAGDTVPDIVGWKTRLEGNLIDNVALEVELTDDDTFGTNVTLGVAILLPGGPRTASKNHSPLNCPVPYVQRNYNVIVSRGSELQRGLTAVNPETGDPYVVEHVFAAAGGDQLGTVQSPFADIAEAQAASCDITFVHAGSVLTDPLVLQPGQRVLGEGVAHYFDLAEFGSVLLPGATAGVDRPAIRGVSGDAVTLASGSEFSGFIVENATGHGIVGRGVRDVIVSDTDVRNTGLDGIFLQDSSGDAMLNRIGVSDTTGAALHVEGGTADVRAGGAIGNTNGHALLVENTVGGTVDLSQAAIQNEGGRGVLIAGADGDAVLGDVTVRNSTGAGVEVRGGGGSVDFQGTTNVDNAAGAGVLIQEMAGNVRFKSADVVANGGGPGVGVADNPGDVAFDRLDVTAGNTTGLEARNSGTVAVSAGTLTSTGASAADIENTEMQIKLTSVSSDGAAYGLRIVNSGGSFLVYGQGERGTGGLIQNADVGVLVADSGAVGLQYLDLDANTTAVDVSETDFFGLAAARVTNSLDYGVRCVNTSILELSNSTFVGAGGVGGNAVVALAEAGGKYTYVFHDNTFTDASEAAIAIRSSGAGDGSTLLLSVKGNEFTSSRAGAAGVSLDYSGTVQASFAANAFAATGGSNRGIDVTARSATDLLSVAASGNQFAFEGDNDIAFRFETLGPSSIALSDNAVVFDAADGTGMDFTLAPSADVVLAGNHIIDNVSGATGVLFRSIAGPSRVAMNGNTIDLLGAAYVVDRGIIFTSVTGTVALRSNLNNAVNGASTAFFAPQGTTSGFLRVNGAAVP